MDQAWLDSLSEDWVSEPRSSGSPVPPISSLPSLSNSTSDSSRGKSSRIPKFDTQNQVWGPPQDINNSPLSERSLNEHNIPLSRRGVRQPSKLKEEILDGIRGRRLSRTLSASTTHSTQQHTVQHKSASLSPKKGFHETPEWKRRLLGGEVAYGEQRDLFSPAGLESIFNPPPAPEILSRKPTTQILDEQSIMPSSPPPYNRERLLGLVNAEKSIADTKRGQVRYNLVSEGGSDFSENDISRSSSFQHTKATSHSSKPLELPCTSGQENAQKNNPHGPRTISGQSDFRNEEFSPVYMPRQNNLQGKLDDEALDLLPHELQIRLEQFRNEATPSKETDSDDFAANGQFVNIRRGGYSQEGSFQRRMLSPSSFPASNESAMLPEDSLQASTPKELPYVKKTRVSAEFNVSHGVQATPLSPQTPRASPTKSGEKSSGGSPLKLFGNYDTFTNQKLLRRLSQFEGDCVDSETESHLSNQNSSRAEINDMSDPGEDHPPPKARQGRSRKINSFGDGDLDTFQFSEPSFNTWASNSEDEDKENLSLPVLNPTTQSKFKFQLGPSPALDAGYFSHRSENKVAAITSTTKQVLLGTSRPGTSSSSTADDVHFTQQIENLQTPRKRNGDVEGKRLPRSPLRNPTPKRRRTFQKSDFEQVDIDDCDADGVNFVDEAHQQMQSVITRKRKDARHGDQQQAANPKVLAMRQILRPRTPTPSQRGSLQYDQAPPLEAEYDPAEHAKLMQERKIAKIQAELDAPDPLKMSMPLGMSQQMQNESRKGSVTTQDFLDEAKKIMAGIRGKARSGLASVEESESENDRYKPTEDGSPEPELEDSYEESTKEPFSRPPSREGKPVERLPTTQANPALLDHLRKYQERSEMDLVIASSMKSLAMAKEASQAAKELDRITDETISRSSGRLLSQGEFTESDPPNIRVSENPDALRKRKHSTSSAIPYSEDRPDVEFPSHGSNASSSQSTTQSIPTGSSRGSDSRRVIAPHTVSHLIPEQLAGMYLDRDRNIWVKRQSVDLLDETEDDPFGDIPDLSVDETQEYHRVKSVAAKRKEAAVTSIHHGEDKPDSQPLPDQVSNPSTNFNLDEPMSSREYLSKTSHTAHFTTKTNTPTDNASQSAFHQNTSTSKQSSHSIPGSFTEDNDRGNPTENAIPTPEEEDFEEEISILDRVDQKSPQRRRNITITFSSPLAQVIGASDDEDSDFNEDENEKIEKRDPTKGNLTTDGIVIKKKGSAQKSPKRKIRSALRTTSRHMSLRNHTFSGRPVSRIDEHDEEDRSQRSVSVVVTTPLPTRRQSSVVVTTPREMDQIGNLSLTPLSEFTFHQADESFGLDVSYVDGGQRYMLGANAKRTLSLSIKELVEKISQVEPYEPFWEHLKQLNLKDKRLQTLHKLDEFCEHLEELDASNNQVSQLDGVPVTVRDLRMTHNQLTDLAAWGHLSNLQYIDISDNQIESLSGFRSLVHLRGLRADNNKIKSLQGIAHLNGLIQLRLRGNCIESLDFSGSRLSRLTDLDLNDNQISEVQNLHALQSLSSLNLEDNDLAEFSVDGLTPLRALRYLKLSGNKLEKLNVSCFPDLRLLYVDRNRLETVGGLLKTKYLDSLSMREQQDGVLIDTSFLSQALEVRKLFLSGNLLTTFQPKVDYLNLQYLELANCGLETLSPEFGCMVANTRVLNLNFNALRDIKPLVGIIRLKKLHLAGNRLSRLRTTTCLLSQFPTLSFADLRNNPLTQGFYPPISETRMVVHRPSNEEVAPQDFVLGEASRAQDTKYVSRLDKHTKMMRRVFEILILSGCTHLKTLDGLGVDRSVLVLKDAIWKSLVEEGVAVDAGSPGKGEAAAAEEVTEKIVEESVVSERWQAEDSFA